jgi:hypothetical protein
VAKRPKDFGIVNPFTENASGNPDRQCMAQPSCSNSRNVVYRADPNSGRVWRVGFACVTADRVRPMRQGGNPTGVGLINGFCPRKGPHRVRLECAGRGETGTAERTAMGL